MALIQCPECNKEISDKVKACPFCGFPFDIKSKIKNDAQQIANNVSNNKLNSINKSIIYLGVGIGLIILVAASFLLIKTIQSQARINRFNSELQTKLIEGSKAKITVDGVYADLITYYENGDPYKEFLSLAKNETEKKNLQKGVYATYQYFCANSFLERQILFIEYHNKDEYLNDDKFIKAVEQSPKCRIKYTEDIYEYYKNEQGNSVFTVNGEIVEIP